MTLSQQILIFYWSGWSSCYLVFVFVCWRMLFKIRSPPFWRMSLARQMPNCSASWSGPLCDRWTHWVPLRLRMIPLSVSVPVVVSSWLRTPTGTWQPPKRFVYQWTLIDLFHFLVTKNQFNKKKEKQTKVNLPFNVRRKARSAEQQIHVFLSLITFNNDIK
jgi:hypothetical protein